MSYISNTPSLINNVANNEVKNINQVPPVGERPNQNQGQVQHYKRLAGGQLSTTTPTQAETGRRSTFPNDRRKTSQRIRRQSILMELRSGIDRRRRHMRADDKIEHIDEKV